MQSHLLPAINIRENMADFITHTLLFQSSSSILQFSKTNILPFVVKVMLIDHIYRSKLIFAPFN